MVKTSPSTTGVQVQSLVRELRSHMPCENENINQNQYCNKFNKDFKKKMLKMMNFVTCIL